MPLDGHVGQSFKSITRGLMLLEAAKRLKQVQVNRGRVTGQTRGD